MARRFRISRGISRRSFRRGIRVNRRNLAGAPMRGGVRL